MPEAARSDELEGWRARGWVGAGLAVGLYALAFLAVAVVAVMFATEGPKHMAEPAPRAFPGPELNARLDRDPHFSYAPRPLPDSEIEPAMRTLAAEGDAGWGPAAPPPARQKGGGR
jgi:hypothetical protein